MKQHAFFAKSNGKRGEIYLYDAIGGSFFDEGITSKTFADQVKSLGNVDAVDIYINSPGGSVFEGISIYNQIKRMPMKKDVHIDGIAASIASVIAMAGDTITMASNGTMMIHDPWGMAMGTAQDMRQSADALDKVRDVLIGTYAARTGNDAKQIGDWMNAETWMTADEAVSRGFATAKTAEQTIKAEFPMLDKFKNTPAPLRKRASSIDSAIARMDMGIERFKTRASPAIA